MTRNDIRQFLDRDWSRIAVSKERAWRGGKRTPTDDLRAADQLRRYVMTIRADWPSPADRAEDLRTHLRVNEALGAVGLRSR